MALPSLNAIRAFEAASRTGSFVAAAAELGVSPAAVSMQVRNLERHLNKSLFLRSHNRITMTEAARELYPAVAGAFAGLGNAVERLTAPERRPRLVVSAPPALAERWLAPIVADFRRAEPRVGIELRIEEDPVDLVAGRVDLRLAEDAFLYGGFVVEPVLTDSLLPLAAPGLASGGDLAADLSRIADDQLIHVAVPPERAAQPSWRDWFETAGVHRRPDPRAGITAPNQSVALTLATRGAGVVLGSRTLAAPEMAGGALAPVARNSIDAGAPWVAVLFHARSRDRLVSAFLRGLGAAGPGRTHPASR